MSAPHSNDVPKNRLAVTEADLDSYYTQTQSNARYVSAVSSSTKVGNLDMDGSALHFIAPDTSGGWARGANWQNRAGDTLGTIGAYGNAEELRYMYFSADGFTGDGIRLYPDETLIVGTVRFTGGTVSGIDPVSIGAVADSDSRLSDSRTPKAHRHDWDEIDGKPTTFPPSNHTHTTAQVTGLDSALSGKAATSHTHTTAQVTGLQAELDGKASAARPGVEVWYGTAAEYNALPTATRNAAGFIAVLT